MELSVKDRLYLPTFLPARGNFKEFNLKKRFCAKSQLAMRNARLSIFAKMRRTSVSNGMWKKNSRCRWSFPPMRWPTCKLRVRKSRTKSCLTICGGLWKRFIMS